MQKDCDIMFKALMKDSMTGFNTRTYFEMGLKPFVERHFDKTNVAVIFGDYNFMKFSNERYGYKKVDVAIKLISKEITAIADKTFTNYYAIRYGGDEICFIVLGAEEKVIKNFVANVKKRIEDLSFETKRGLSLALGYEMKNNHPKLDSVIRSAQKKMKKDKERMQIGIDKNAKEAVDLLIPTIKRMVHSEDMEYFIAELTKRLVNSSK